MFAVGLLIGFALNVACAVICFMKGKPTFGVLGILVSGIFCWVGAIRLAKPGSSWYQRYELQPWKQETAKMRFPKEAHVLATIAPKVEMDTNSNTMTLRV